MVVRGVIRQNGEGKNREESEVEEGLLWKVTAGRVRWYSSCCVGVRPGRVQNNWLVILGGFGP